MGCRAFTLAGLLAITACDSGDQVTGDFAPRAPVVMAVDCADAAELTRLALDGHREAGQTRGDQEKILIGSRASFFASLAVVADLECRLTSADVDEALKPALEVATRASSTGGFYDGAQLWIEANFMATQVIADLVRQLPDTSSP